MFFSVCLLFVRHESNIGLGDWLILTTHFLRRRPKGPKGPNRRRVALPGRWLTLIGSSYTDSEAPKKKIESSDRVWIFRDWV